MLDYKQVIDQLFLRNFFGGIKFGLENMYRLDEKFNHPHRNFKIIHVAGSNGKGSVCAKIAKSLEISGYRVGLFTSPHISSFRERICENGKMISKKAVCSLLSEIISVADRNGISATFFELTTMLAFCYFSRRKVDFVVLETGLGGRWDATNIVKPILSVITSISLEHTDLLGGTKQKIAREKAGIIKTGIPVVVGSRACPQLMKEAALWKRSIHISVEDGPQEGFEMENRRTARAALEYLRGLYKIPDEALSRGLMYNLPCRFEIFTKKELAHLQGSLPQATILDVAHNLEGLEELFAMISRTFPDKPLRIVVGLSKGKDHVSCLNFISQYSNEIHLVEAGNGRGVPLAELKSALMLNKIHPASFEKSICSTVGKALELAACNGEIIVVCGSFFIMNAVRQALGVQRFCDPVDMNERALNFSKI